MRRRERIVVCIIVFDDNIGNRKALQIPGIETEITLVVRIEARAEYNLIIHHYGLLPTATHDYDVVIGVVDKRKSAYVPNVDGLTTAVYPIRRLYGQALAAVFRRSFYRNVRIFIPCPELQLEEAPISGDRKSVV